MKLARDWLPQCWRAAWLVLGIANAALYLSAEIQFEGIPGLISGIPGVPRSAIEIWIRAASVVMTYPFDDQLTRAAVGLRRELVGMPENKIVVSQRRWQF